MKRENRKTHCFIDYENVHESGFEGVEALSDGDSVTIFISSVSHKISLVVLETLLRKKCELNIIHTIGTGKNNLDFQLIAEVGYQIGRHAFESQPIQFVIISKDRGYENVVTAFLNRGFHILQCETLQKIKLNEEEAGFEPMVEEQAPEWEFAATIQKCLVSLKMSASDLKRIDVIFKESHSLNVLHDRLVKAFGKKGNHPIYGKLKSLHKQYQKTLPAVEPEGVDALSERMESMMPALEMTSERHAGEAPQSLEVFWDQLLEESGESNSSTADDTPAVEIVAPVSLELSAQTEVPVPEVIPTEPPEKLPEKKKRRPGRPRKKNGTNKPDSAQNQNEPTAAAQTEATSDIKPL